MPETKHSATPLAYAKICGPCEIREFPSSCTMSWLELEPRFVDCDDLNDPTRVLNYVGQDTETLVVLGSPELLTRKWCVGEICTARIQRQNSSLEPSECRTEKNSSTVKFERF